MSYQVSVAFDRAAFGKRLKNELDARGMSINKFQQAVEERAGEDVIGTSYGTINTYTRGQGSVAGPHEELLEAMAEVLGVLPRWLRDGEGPRDEKEEAIRLHEPAPHELWATWEGSDLHELLEELGLDAHPFYAAGIRLGLLSLEELEKIADHPGVPDDLWAKAWKGFGERLLLHPLHVALQQTRAPTPETRRLWRSALRASLLAVEQALEVRDAEIQLFERAYAEKRAAMWLAVFEDDEAFKRALRRVLGEDPDSVPTGASPTNAAEEESTTEEGS